MGKPNGGLSDTNANEIVLYQPDETIRLEVRMGQETVWLTQSQIAELFGTQRPAITKHLNNIFKSQELNENSVCSILELTANDGKSYKTKFYNLDAILSVGYRVNSINATLFRQWANKILKEYLLRGYSINQRLEHIERNVEKRFSQYDRILEKHQNQIDFFVRTSLPPVEGIFYEGQIFDAYVFVCDLVKTARQRIILIDNYIDETTLAILDKRNTAVAAHIVTRNISNTLQTDIARHNSQYAPISTIVHAGCHDRFLLIDDTVFHFGASFKDLGKKLFAFEKMEISSNELLNQCCIVV